MLASSSSPKNKEKQEQTSKQQLAETWRFNDLNSIPELCSARNPDKCKTRLNWRTRAVLVTHPKSLARRGDRSDSEGSQWGCAKGPLHTSRYDPYPQNHQGSMLREEISPFPLSVVHPYAFRTSIGWHCRHVLLFLPR
eukprot:2262122-Amphidinium_carterae.1